MFYIIKFLIYAVLILWCFTAKKRHAAKSREDSTKYFVSGDKEYKKDAQWNNYHFFGYTIWGWILLIFAFLDFTQGIIVPS
ncbi:MAG: hypothetical protein KH704_01575 [Clostridiales bacterium]|nr:hypothetical protein [Clostridiales bacterium]